MKKIILVGVAVLSFLGSLSVAQELELRTAAQNSAPKYYIAEDKSTQGLCPDIIRAIERIDPEITFKGYENFVPFKRLQYQLEKGEIDVFFGMKMTAERLEKYRFIDIPLYNLSYKMAKRAIDTTNYGETNEINNLSPEIKTLTVNGSATAAFIKKENPDMLIDDSPRSPSNMIQMLLRGRGDLAFYHDLGLSSVIKSLQVEKEIFILPNTFLSYSHFVAFSPEVPMQTVNRVKSALVKLKASGDLDQIFKRHIVEQQDDNIHPDQQKQ